MAVNEYQDENNQTRFRVYVNIRSKTNTSLRAQKRAAGFKTKSAALKKEKELVRVCEREILEKESQGDTWGNLVSDWEKHLNDAKLQSTTRDNYVSAIHKHTFSWMSRPASSIAPSDVREVLKLMEIDGSSPSYQNKIKVIINQVFTFGIEEGIVKGIDRSPSYGIKLKRREEKKPEILTIQEIRKLLSEAQSFNHKWYPVWAVALLTGMRNGELYALLWSDIDWENKMISVTKSYNTQMRKVKSTKSGNWRTIPISQELESILKKLKLEAGKRKEVLPRLTGWNKGEQARILRQFCLGIGLPSIRFHTLRACFATQLIRNGTPPIQIQKICGWKDLETMQHYVRLAGIETKGVTEALKVLPDQQVMAKVVNLFQENRESGGQLDK